MNRLHEDSSLDSTQAVRSWREQRNSFPPEGTSSTPSLETLPREPLERVIRRRGSARIFERVPIGQAELTNLLGCATAPLEADCLLPGAHLNQVYLTVHAVEALTSGAYFYSPAARSLKLLKPGDFRTEAAYLALEQRLAGDCSAAFFFLAPMEAILERFGPRGYRMMQLEAGIMGGRVYLGAYAQRLAATGLTFFDEEVVNFFRPHAEGKVAVFLVAVGKKPASPRRLGGLPL